MCLVIGRLLTTMHNFYYTTILLDREAPTYYAPAELIPQLEQCRDAMMALDASCLHPNGGRKSLVGANFVAVRPGDEILLKGICSGSKTR
jgi:hypothetical protein